MNKRGSKWIVFSVILVVALFIGMFLYMSLFKPRNNSGQFTALKNPADNLTIDQVAEKFDEEFVYYLLASIKAYNLHNPPLSSEKPRINIMVGDDSYSAIIDAGRILVSKELVENPDIKIVTTKSEAAMMVKYPDYVKPSFESGKSSIELLAGKTALFSKGYLNLYTEVTGKSVTGNVLKIYSE